MSIFGSNPDQVDSEVANNVDLSDYAKKDYVDQKDSLRVLKNGDTMSGNLNMRRGLVHGLPTDYPPNYIGDEAVSWVQAIRLMNEYLQMVLKLDGHSAMLGALQMGNHNINDVKDPLQPQDAATKNYVDLQRHKPVIITVWAERKQTARRTHEWSFGGNASGVGANFGYKMLAPGRILRFGLEMATRNKKPITYGKVHITVNGSKTRYVATLFDGWQPENRLPSPLELKEGDVINFTTTDTTPEVTAEVATLLIELDL